MNNKKNSESGNKKLFNELSFVENKVLLDSFELLGVKEIIIKKSSTNIAELQLKINVDIKGLS